MKLAAIYFLIMLYPIIAKNILKRSHKNQLKWKSRNRQKLTRTHQLRDAESYTYYLPRASSNNGTFNCNNSPSFEDVVSQLKKIGILDLPNVSVVRKVNSFQSRRAKRIVSSSSKPSKRCGIISDGTNPCGACLRDDRPSKYSIEGVATLKARDFNCTPYKPCLNAAGECQKLFRYFILLAKDGNDWQEKTLEVPVACICARRRQ